MNVALVGGDGKPTQAFHRWWQSVVETIEAQEAVQDATIEALQAAQLDIIAAQEAITEAQEDILAQLDLINAVTTSNAISASWMTPPSVLSASDAGTDATITVANFTRVYDDGQTVAITGAAITALAYSTT